MSSAESCYQRSQFAEIDSGRVLHAYREACQTLLITDVHDQSSTKDLTILMADLLAGIVYGQLTPRPELWATKTSAHRSDNLLQFCERKLNECMIDVGIYAGATDPFDTLLTAESEAFDTHPCSQHSNCLTSDYLWDLYKLLQVFSPIRLFVARVGTYERCAAVSARVQQFIYAYQNCLRQNDQIFSLILPSRIDRLRESYCVGWKLVDGVLSQV